MTRHFALDPELRTGRWPQWPEEGRGLQARSAAQISLPDRRKLGSTPDLPPLASDLLVICLATLGSCSGHGDVIAPQKPVRQPQGGREIQDLELGAEAPLALSLRAQNFIGEQRL